MSQVHELIETLRDRTDLSVADQPDAWRISIPNGSGNICRVTVPHERFEWFADVERRGKEVWSDSMEHYGSLAPELDAEMAASIASFVERVTARELRLPLAIHEE